jgi:hypothetical protein
MPEEKAPSSAAFLPVSLIIRRRGMAEPGHGKAKELGTARNR